jgi:hypothetical protein
MRCSQNSLTYVPLVGEAGDRAGRVRPDTWQLQEHGWVRRYQAVVLLDHDAGRPVQVHHPPVAAQVAPGADRVRERRLGEGLHRREALQEALVERDRARHLDLLQHHLGDQDAPGVARAPPRQVAPVLVEPREQLLPHGPVLASAPAAALPRCGQLLRLLRHRGSLRMPTHLTTGESLAAGAGKISGDSGRAGKRNRTPCAIPAVGRGACSSAATGGLRAS